MPPVFGQKKIRYLFGSHQYHTFRKPFKNIRYSPLGKSAGRADKAKEDSIPPLDIPQIRFYACNLNRSLNYLSPETPLHPDNDSHQ